MTTAADDSAVEDAFEALLAGRPAREGQAGLAAFTEAVRASATRPGRPHAALAELLATGLLADQSSPSVRTARPAGSPPARRPSRVRTRRRTAMIFPVLLAKFLSAGAVAQAATGAGVVVIAFTGVGAVGALPTPAQETFAAVVETVTPLEAPSSDEPTTEVPAEEEETLTGDGETTEDVATPEVLEGTEVADDAAATAAYVQEWAVVGPEGSESFSAWVHEGNKDGRVKDWLRAHGMTFGNVVSAHASGKGFTDAQKAILGVETDKSADVVVEVPVESVVEDTDTQDDAPVVTAESGSRGKSGKQAGPGKAQGQAKNQDQDRAKGNGRGNGRGNG